MNDNLSRYKTLCNLDGLDINYGEHSTDGVYDSIEFNYAKGDISAQGEASINEEKISLSILYQSVNAGFDLEFTIDKFGTEAVKLSNLENGSAHVTFEKDEILNVEISNHEGKWVFNRPGDSLILIPIETEEN